MTRALRCTSERVTSVSASGSGARRGTLKTKMYVPIEWSAVGVEAVTLAPVSRSGMLLLLRHSITAFISKVWTSLHYLITLAAPAFADIIRLMMNATVARCFLADCHAAMYTRTCVCGTDATSLLTSHRRCNHYRLLAALVAARFRIKKILNSASKLYRPGDRHLSEKLVLTICGYRVPRDQSDGSLRPYSWMSRPEIQELVLRN
jgi:hypothetical protein